MEAQDSLISDLVKISGYADAELRITSNKNDNNSFRIRHLSLFFSKKVQEKWQFFSEIEFEDAPKIESDTFRRTAARQCRVRSSLNRSISNISRSLAWNSASGAS